MATRQHLRSYCRRVTLDEALIVSDERAAEVVALDDALTGLADLDPRKSRDWTLAKAWLRRAIESQ